MEQQFNCRSARIHPRDGVISNNANHFVVDNFSVFTSFEKRESCREKEITFQKRQTTFAAYLLVSSPLSPTSRLNSQSVSCFAKEAKPAWHTIAHPQSPSPIPLETVAVSL